MANKPIIPFNPNGPVLSGSNDTGDTKPYVGKPKPQPTRPPGMGYSPSGGSFDASSLRRAPRPTMVLPGQGQGPMPVGTKPLPQPSIRDARGDLGMIRDASMNQYPGVPNWGGGMGVPRGAGGYDGRPLGVVDGDRRPPGWDGQGVDTGFSGNGGFGPRGGYAQGQTIGSKPFWTGPPGTEPSGNWGPGRPFDPSGMKPPAMPGGESVAPGMGMPTQYGGGPSGRGGVEVPYDGMNGAVQRGPGAPGMPSGGKPPQGQQPGMPGQGGGQRPQRPQRPQQGGGANPQAMQQGAQALYSDNTIPHEFKGQLLQAAQSGNAQAFNEMLFNSNIPHETKLKLQQMFGYGGQGGGVQAATPDQLTQQVQGVTDAYNGSKGSPYYGAF